MQNVASIPYKVMVSLLWSQYNKLSEPLKEAFISLANSMAEQTGNLDINTETNILDEEVNMTRGP